MWITSLKRNIVIGSSLPGFGSEPPHEKENYSCVNPRSLVLALMARMCSTRSVTQLEV